jgi:hypothetical protein
VGKANLSQSKFSPILLNMGLIFLNRQSTKPKVRVLILKKTSIIRITHRRGWGGPCPLCFCRYVGNSTSWWPSQKTHDLTGAGRILTLTITWQSGKNSNTLPQPFLGPVRF